MDRRTLIKRSVAVGAAAWTAPTIVGSMASPAAAQTAPAGCSALYFPKASTCTAATPVVSGVCSPVNWPASAAADFSSTGCVSSVPAGCDDANDIVAFTIGDQCNCVFVSGITEIVPGGCAAGVLSNGGQTITFTKPTGDAWGDTNGFRMVVSCGGAVCDEDGGETPDQAGAGPVAASPNFTG